jgi:hypothetical protein
MSKVSLTGNPSTFLSLKEGVCAKNRETTPGIEIVLGPFGVLAAPVMMHPDPQHDKRKRFSCLVLQVPSFSD